MLIGEIISVALGALRANKLRSLLTMLGIVIGVAAVIAMIALGNGAQKAVKDRISALGTTLLTIQPGQAFGMGGIRSGEQQRMTMDDAKAIEERAEYIIAVQPEMQRQLQIQYNNRNANTSIVSSKPAACSRRDTMHRVPALRSSVRPSRSCSGSTIRSRWSAKRCAFAAFSSM
jgi:putative ABC transport system permease protein